MHTEELQPQRTRATKRRHGLLTRFVRCRLGGIAAIVAIAAPVLIAFGVGVAVETGMWYAIKRQQQSATDAAALAGERELINNEANAGIRKQAACSALQNAFPSAGTVTSGCADSNLYSEMGGIFTPDTVCEQPPSMFVQNPPATGHYSVAANITDGTTPQDYVEAILCRPVHTFSFFLPSVKIWTRAVAGPKRTACAIVGLADVSHSVYITGSAKLIIDGICSAASKLVADSIYIQGGAQTILDAGTVWSGGGVFVKGSPVIPPASSIYQYQPPPGSPPYWPDTYRAYQSSIEAAIPPSAVPVAFDPAAPMPSINPDGTVNNNSKGDPLVYCPIALKTGSTTLTSGVYIIEGETTAGYSPGVPAGTAFYLGSSASIGQDVTPVPPVPSTSNPGVTFILTGVPQAVGQTAYQTACGTNTNIKGGLVDIDGGSADLAAPTKAISGTQGTTPFTIPSGLLFYQDPGPDFYTKGLTFSAADTTCVTSSMSSTSPPKCNLFTATAQGFSLQGVSYTPATAATFTGSSASQCFAIMAYIVTYTGNTASTITAKDCLNLGSYVPEIKHAVLVE